MLLASASHDAFNYAVFSQCHNTLSAPFPVDKSVLHLNWDQTENLEISKYFIWPAKVVEQTNSWSQIWQKKKKNVTFIKDTLQLYPTLYNKSLVCFV